MKADNKMFWGIFLIFLGAVGIINKLHILNGYFATAAVGIGFLLVYAIRGAYKSYRNIGLLIPGCIILASIPMDLVGKYSILSVYKDSLELAILATTFLIIYLVHTLQASNVKKGSKNWPIYVAIILYVISVLVYLTQICDSNIGKLVLNNLWPVVLIGAGIVILIRNFTKKE